MITKTYLGDQANCRLVIRRNCSLTWGQTKLAVCIIALAPLSVALAAALAGLWPVVPFAGLELLAVGLCFYHCALDARKREVVTLDEHEVIIEKGRRWAESRWSLNRYWAVVTLNRAAGGLRPSRLWIRAHSEKVEIGRFLPEQERVALAGELRGLLVH